MSGGPAEDIPARVQKVLDIPKDVKIYLYGGHGGDVCDPKTHAPILKRVPKGCIYITISECGVVSLTSEERERNFRSKDPEIRKILQFPYLSEHKILLKELLEVESMKNIHIKYPGDEYVDSTLYPLAYWDNEKDGRRLRYSGLCEKSKLEALGEKGHLKNYPTQKEDPHLTILKTDVLEMFEASVYPTYAEVKKALDNTWGGPRGTSIFGGQFEEVEKRIEYEMGFVHGVSDPSGPDAFCNVSYMMREFPGIHYNVVCRSVGEHCLAHAVARRTPSEGIEVERLRLGRENLLKAKMAKNLAP
jgi:hypothetical protein